MTSFICLRFTSGSIHGIHSAAQDIWSPAKWDSYDPVAFGKYYQYRPFLVAHRVMLIVAEVFMLTMWHWAEKDIHKRAAKVKHFLFGDLLASGYTINGLLSWWLSCISLQGLRRSVIWALPYLLSLSGLSWVVSCWCHGCSYGTVSFA